MKWSILTALLFTATIHTAKAQEMTEAVIVDASHISSLNIDDKSKSKRFAEASEQLLTPHGFMHALELANKSLEFDSLNKKAKFIQLYIEQLVPFQGFVKKFSSIAESYSDSSRFKKKYLYYKSIGSKGDALYQWMRDSDQVYENASQVQQDMILARNAALKFRDFLKNNADMTFKITNYLDLTPDSNKEFFGFGRTNLENCNVNILSNLKFRMSPCRISAQKVDVEMVDVEILRTHVSSILAYAIILTGYTMDGWFALDSTASHMKLSHKDMYLFLEAMPGFGEIRKDHQLQLAAILGSDVFGLYRYMSKNQKVFCPPGLIAVQNDSVIPRPGKLLDKGACLPVEFGPVIPNPNGKEINGFSEPVEVEKYFAMYQSFFSGRPVEVFAYDSDGKEYKTRANYSNVLRNPILDLKQIFPATYNECGMMKTYRDPTLGGIFPDADANTFMLYTSNLDRKCSK